MASKLPPPTPRLKSHARTVSLDSGGKTPPGPKYFNAESTHKSVAERRSSRPAHMEQKRTMTGRVADGQDDHSRVKEQLAMIERSKFNLMQDLARAKRNVDELTMKVSGVNGSCKNDKVHSVEKESAVFLEKEGWQVELDAMKQRYELALMELQTSKQAMESLKHELMVCVEAKDEAVRLAGEAMSAAESTARRVEVLSAELSSTKGSTLLGDCTTAGMDDLIDELPESMESLIEVPHKSTTQEETLQPLVAAEINKNTTESLKSENVEANVNALKVEDVQHKDREMSDVLTNGSVEALQKELAAAKEAEHTAIQKLLFVQAGMETVTVEAEKFKNAESIAQDLLTKTCSQLEEAEEKLAKASVEDAALLASLESLKAELEKSQQEAIQALDREAIARNKTMEVLDRMERARESNQAELSMWKEKEASARAMVESLQMDFERHKSEATLAAEKESIAAAKVSEMIEELGRNRNELIEQQKHSSIEIAALREKLDANQAKLVALEERESSSASSIATLEFDLQKKQAEVVDLKCMLSEVESKAEATSAELSRLREDNLQLAELKMKEREASAEVTALNIEVSGLKQAVEEALNAGRASRDELSKVEATFQNVVLERDEATREMKEVYLQAELSRQSATNLLADAKAAREDTERALNEVRAASKAAVDEALLACKLAEEKAQLAREETSVEKEKLEAALKDVEIASMEVVKMKKEAQSVREEADIQKGALAVEKERANAFQDEAQGVLGELVKLRSELTQLQTDVKEAVSARKDAEFRLQLATEQLEADKLREKEEGHVKDMSQEEMASLKEKLRVCEDQLKISTSEAEALQSCRAELMRELETVKVEREVSKRAVMDAHQHLADMEKAKRVMEADIQRLLDDSKLWKCSKDTRDILVLSEMNGINGHVLMADSRDEKPQPDSPARELLQNMDSTYLHINTENRGDEMIAEKEEEGEAPVEEAPIRVGKKKKPALLHRLHSYLDKKKTVQAP